MTTQITRRLGIQLSDHARLVMFCGEHNTDLIRRYGDQFASRVPQIIAFTWLFEKQNESLFLSGIEKLIKEVLIGDPIESSDITPIAAIINGNIALENYKRLRRQAGGGKEDPFAPFEEMAGGIFQASGSE